jgi:nicotinate-nucleotide pyrophosphorylase (carboxylating)
MSDYMRLHSRNFNFRNFITQAIREDVGDGDHTSLSTIPANRKGAMKLLVKETGVLAGVEAAFHVFRHVQPSVRIDAMLGDGAKVKPGDVAFIVHGNVRKLLASERLVLNIMQRMSGIATATSTLQALCKGTRAKVADTRKTTPGFRFFEKWAVHIGGGSNHRFGLYDMILIKDNHVDFAGSIEKAIDAAHGYMNRLGRRIPVEAEARSIDDVKRVIAHGGVQRIMLDNFTVRDTKKAVRLIGNRIETESSGGITAKNIAGYAKCGVHLISVGALTHQVKSLDLSLKAIETIG